MKRLFAMVLCLVMVLSLLPSAAFAETEQTQTMTEEEAAAILKERRDTVYNNMMSMATVLWRATEDINYTFASYKVTIVKGRLYRGLPYTYAKGNYDTFMEYAGAPNEKGEYPISGITSEMLDGSSSTARLGNSCSGAAYAAYSQIGASVWNDGAGTVAVNRGYLRVGVYDSNPDNNTNSKADCIANGHQVIFQAYALAQYADLVSCSGHTMMTQKVNVVYAEDGTIDGDLSTMTVVHQNPDPIRNNRYYTSGPYSEANYGEKVYRTFLVDDEWTFNRLFDAGYLPYTCKELVDPSPLPELEVTDTVSEHNFSTIMTGEIQANRQIERVTMTITDENGNQVQQGTAWNYRANQEGANVRLYYDLEMLQYEEPTKMKGFLNPRQLGVGNYHCRLDVRLMTGEVVEKVRDFDFTVTEADLGEGWVDNSNLEFTEVDGKKMAVCPVCGGDPVEWTELPQITSNTSFAASHYYVAEDLSNKARYSLPKSTTACVHLNGHNITSTSQVFWLSGSTAMLNVMGNGIVKGGYTSEDNVYGATLNFSAATAKARLYGGTYGHSYSSQKATVVLAASQPNLTIYSGATFCRMENAQGAHIEIRSGTVDLRGGRILGGTNTTGYGGNVRVVSSDTHTGWPSTFTMHDGIIAGGRAKYGGNVYVARSDGHGSKLRTFTMEGGLMHWGIAGYAAGSEGSGGNLYATTGSVINLNGGLVSYGKSYSGGGNLYIRNGAQVTIGGIVEKGNGDYGSDGAAGGNIYLLGETVKETDPDTGEETTTYTPTELTITGIVRDPMKAATSGGNIFSSLANVTVDGGIVSGGIATSRGGNIYVTNVQGNLTVKNGGKIINGSAPNGGNVGTNIASKIIIEDGEISGGTATEYGPDIRFHSKGTLTVSGGKVGHVYGLNSTINLGGNGTVEQLELSSATVKPAATWTGAANVSWSSTHLSGNMLTKVTCTTFPGKLMYNGQIPVLAKDNAAYLANASVGEELYLTSAEALAAANGNTVKLYTDETVTLEKDTWLDINGHTVTATGSGKVYGIDSSNDDYEGGGTLTYSGEIASAAQDPITGKQYVAIAENGTATFHRLGGQMTAVTLRPDAAGVYFKAKYECDDILAPLVKNYGVVLSVGDMPGADFATEQGDINIATVGTEAFASGLETTSTSVFGILKNSRKPELNDRYGKMKIYANTYVELADGTVVMGENGAERSLYDVLAAIDENWADYEESQSSILEFFRAWATKGLSSWEFTNIK